MQLSKRLLAVILTVVVASPLVAATALAGKPEEPNLIQALWNAIANLQAEDTGLQSEINTRTPQSGNITYMSASFVLDSLSLSGEDSDSAGYTSHIADVQLPQGVRITKIAMYEVDKMPGDGESYSISLTLTKLPLGTSTMNQYQQYYQIVRVTSHDTVPPDQETAWMARESETVPQSTIDDRMDIVNNNDGFYYLSVRLPNEPTTPPGEAPQFTIFWAAQIEYEYP